MPIASIICAPVMASGIAMAVKVFHLARVSNMTWIASLSTMHAGLPSLKIGLGTKPTACAALFALSDKLI